jgi:hypothetical protein
MPPVPTSETALPERIARHATTLGLSAQAVNHAVFDALAWAHEMMDISAC